MKASIYCIGERVRDRRRQKNWTQKELAQRAGTTYKYISHVENGYKYPSLEMLICLARELEVTLDYLIGTDQCAGDPAEDIQNLIVDCSASERSFLLDVLIHIKDGLKRLNE